MKIPEELWLELTIKGYEPPLAMVEFEYGYSWNDKKYLFLVSDNEDCDYLVTPRHIFFASWSVEEKEKLLGTIGMFRLDDPKLLWLIDHAEHIQRRGFRAWYDLYDKDGVYLSINTGYKFWYFCRRKIWRIKSILGLAAPAFISKKPK